MVHSTESYTRSLLSIEMYTFANVMQGRGACLTKNGVRGGGGSVSGPEPNAHKSYG